MQVISQPSADEPPSSMQDGSGGMGGADPQITLTGC